MVEEEWSNVRSKMFGFAIAAAGVGISLCLGACSTGPPWTLSQSPEEISLRWYPDATPDNTANWLAQVHCQSWGKNAELVSTAQDGSAQLAQFRCR
jgi:(2Fe-2S) ferredoxin